MMTTTYSLGAHLDSAAAPPLSADLLEHRGEPLCIDAADVAFAGALCVQILVAAQKQWREDGHEFHITPASGGLLTAVQGLGVPLSSIGVDPTDMPTSEEDA